MRHLLILNFFGELLTALREIAIYLDKESEIDVLTVELILNEAFDYSLLASEASLHLFTPNLQCYTLT